jgi:23S rRNA (adenine2030-N6)-methyltransferase
MLSYRHAFHAGNHADILKHLVLVLCMQHMNSKDKPWLLLDTHAGAGLYAMDSEQAKKTGEYVHGIARLWNRSDLPAPLKPYMAALRCCNGDGLKLRRYPGSPWLAAHHARGIDTLRFCELHSTDFALLRRQFKDAGRHVKVEQSDGFEAMKAALPPASRMLAATCPKPTRPTTTPTTPVTRPRPMSTPKPTPKPIPAPR